MLSYHKPPFFPSSYSSCRWEFSKGSNCASSLRLPPQGWKSIFSKLWIRISRLFSTYRTCDGSSNRWDTCHVMQSVVSEKQWLYLQDPKSVSYWHQRKTVTIFKKLFSPHLTVKLTQSRSRLRVCITKLSSTAPLSVNIVKDLHSLNVLKGLTTNPFCSRLLVANISCKESA